MLKLIANLCERTYCIKKSKYQFGVQLNEIPKKW